MGLINTRQHLKFVQDRIHLLKHRQDAVMTFCLLSREGSTDVLLHLDQDGTTNKYRDPVAIHQVLKKTTAFNISDNKCFFQNITEIVSMTGIARHGGKRGIRFEKLSGRGGQRELEQALLLLRTRGYMVDASGDRREEPSEETREAIEALMYDFGHVFIEIFSDPGRYFRSIQHFAETVETLQREGAPRDLMRILSRAYREIQDWSAEAFEPVTEALTSRMDTFPARAPPLISTDADDERAEA